MAPQYLKVHHSSRQFMVAARIVESDMSLSNNMTEYQDIFAIYCPEVLRSIPILSSDRTPLHENCGNIAMHT